MTVHATLLEGIGATPLVRLGRSAQHLRPQILVKLESANPGGSVKDRAALSMVRAAEAQGLLRPGGTIIESTSGNTGVGLALVAASLGYRAVIFPSALISAQKIALMRAFGAEVRLVEQFLPREDPGSPYAQAAALAASTPGGWHADQYDNPANPLAHELGTGPEIWEQTEHRITHLVAAVGTGGTISGTSRALQRLSGGRVRIIAADPEASIYGGGDGGPHLVEGAGHRLHPDAAEDRWPRSFDPSVVHEYVRVSDREAIATARRTARTEGLLLGTSAGAALAAALRVAERLGPEDRIVVLAPDTGRNGLSTYYDDDWLADRGFTGPDLAPEAPGRLHVRDLVRAVAPPGEVLGAFATADPTHPTIGAGASPAAALSRLDASHPGWVQARVLQDARIVGVVDRGALGARPEAPAGSLPQPEEAASR